MSVRPFGVRVAATARRTGAAHEVVLRDYALSYLLAAISGARELGDALAFKGGTALRKCFASFDEVLAAVFG